MDQFDPDLRKFKVGDWEGAKLQAKVNGKWVYFFRENDQTPVNTKEPISFDVPYVPPNHQNEKFILYPQEYIQPLKSEYLKKNLRNPPPLKYLKPQNQNQRIIPTAWQSRPMTHLSSLQHRPQLKTAQTQPISPRGQLHYTDQRAKLNSNAGATLYAPNSYRVSYKNSKNIRLPHRNSFSELSFSEN